MLQNPTILDSLRQSRTIGRALAAWLLLWFCAMALPVPVAAIAPADEVALAAMQSDCGGDAHHHAAGAAAQHDTHDAPAGHGGHGAGASQHCPLCVHAAAPPLALSDAQAAAAAPDAVPAQGAAAPLRVRTDAPFPARGPPSFA